MRFAFWNAASIVWQTCKLHQAAFDQLLQVEIPRFARQMVSPEQAGASILPTQCPVKASELNAFISALHSHGINVRYESLFYLNVSMDERMANFSCYSLSFFFAGI